MLFSFVRLHDDVTSLPFVEKELVVSESIEDSAPVVEIASVAEIALDFTPTLTAQPLVVNCGPCYYLTVYESNGCAMLRVEVQEQLVFETS